MTDGCITVGAWNACCTNAGDWNVDDGGSIVATDGNTLSSYAKATENRALSSFYCVAIDLPSFVYPCLPAWQASADRLGPKGRTGTADRLI